jgi:hypothetical protein
MKKLLLITLLLYNTAIIWAQDNTKNLAKEDLTKLCNEFVLKQKEFKAQDSIFKSFTSKITTNTTDNDFAKLKEQKDKARLLHIQLDSIYDLAVNYTAFYKSKFAEKKDQDEIQNFCNIKHQKIDAIPEVKEEMKTFLYFGKDKVIAENDGIFKDKTANLIFNDILEIKSEAYLGDFIIPQKGQKINSIRYKKDSKTVFFKNIKIHIVEGSLQDIQLFVTDEKNNELLFENRTPISLLRATKQFPLNTLFFKLVTSNNKDIALNIDNNENYGIILSDVLLYTPNPGDNYVPEDLTLEFPIKTNGVPDNINNSVKYKVNQNTSLQNVVELRTYTDFLGLFGDAANGIVQLEGKANFFIAPFNLANSSVYLFKKVTPFVHFSKIEKDVRNLNLSAINDSTSAIKTPLEILEKSYLKMGFDLSVLSFKFTKEFPFDANLYTTAKYQIADLLDKDSIQVNYKSLGLGAGLALEFKRYNNFGFIYSAEFTKYNANSFNEIEGFVNPNHFWVFKNEAEVYYFPNKTKEQAIFLRFKTFNNSTKDNREAFYQLQFGYRFAIGVSKIKQ